MRRDLIDDWLYRLHDRRRARHPAWRRRDVGGWFRRGGQGGRGFRPDIQGLRAVAVLLVALNHAGVKRLSGGYVGVDVFFVVSGFLITGWLLRRSQSAGEVPFRKFYAARARRILPAATLALVATVVASYHWLNYVRALQAFRDSIWAAFFAANVRFADIGTDYFTRNDPPSPLQHFWTLAVEEQFYVVWPALLALAVVGLRWRHPRGSLTVDVAAKRRLTALLVVGIAVSLAYSIHETSINPVGAYFSTFARAWELAVGALVAVAASQLALLPRWIRASITWAGLAGVCAAAMTYTSQTPFPGYAALLPVLRNGAGGDRRPRRRTRLGCRTVAWPSTIAPHRRCLVWLLPLALADPRNPSGIPRPSAVGCHEPNAVGGRVHA